VEYWKVKMEVVRRTRCHCFIIAETYHIIVYLIQTQGQLVSKAATFSTQVRETEVLTVTTAVNIGKVNEELL